MIEVRGLSHAYGDRPVLDRLDIDLPTAGVTALVGRNGIGKTTLLKVLGGVTGTGGPSVQAVRRALRMVYIDHEFLAFEHLTVAEMLSLVWAQLEPTPFPIDLYREVLPEDMLGTAIGALSLGQRQRTVLVIALMTPCDVLLLDEPFNGLDTTAKRIFTAMLRQKSARACVLYVTHDHGEIVGLADHCLRLAGPDAVHVVAPIEALPGLASTEDAL